MFCSKCGYQLKPEDEFCPNCGEPVPHADANAGETAQPYGSSGKAEEHADSNGGQEPINDSKPVQNGPTRTPIGFDPQTGAPIYEEKNVKKAASPAKKNNGIPIKAVIGIVIAAAAVVVLIFVLRGRNTSSDKLDKKLVYVDGEKIYYIPNIDKKNVKSIELTRVKNLDDAGQASGVDFSSDQKYLYFFSDVDVDDDLGTLCRILTSKISEDEDKTDDNIEEIDSNVKYGTYNLTTLPNNKLLYIKSGDELRYYDGKETKRVAKHVSSYAASSDGNNVIFTTYDDDTSEYELYKTSITNSDKQEKIDDEISYFSSLDYDKSIYYKTADDDGDYDVYESLAGADPEKIFSDVSDMSYTGDESFYVKADTLSINLYDIVDDPYAEAEKDIKEPDEKDYLVEISQSDALSQYDQSNLKNYSGTLDQYVKNNYNINSEFGMYVIYNFDDGNEYYYSTDTRKFYSLDYDKYSSDYDNYYASQDHISLRNELKNTTVKVKLYDLYLASSGLDGDPIDTNIYPFMYSSDDSLIMYAKLDPDNLPKLISFDDIYSVDSTVSDLESYGISNYIYNDPDEIQWYYRFDNGDAQEFDYVNYDRLVINESKNILYASYSNGDDDSTDTLTSYTIKNGVLSDNDDEISDDVSSWTLMGDDLYYFTDLSDDGEEADLYRFRNGKEEQIAESVSQSGSFNQVFDDGNIMTASDYQDDDYSADITLNVSGKDKDIASGVTDYTYVNADKILYEKNGNLYMYTGKDDEKKLANDVDVYKFMGGQVANYIY